MDVFFLVFLVSLDISLTEIYNFDDLIRNVVRYHSRRFSFYHGRLGTVPLAIIFSDIK